MHPTQKLSVIKFYSTGKILEELQWGLTPSWVQEREVRSLINARLETLGEKITFKNLIKNYRCLVVADGYYEWKREEKEKIPHYFTRTDSSLMFFTAIHQNNQFCIITKEASNKVKEIHHREPLIINEEQISNYLDIKKEGMDILQAISSPELKFHEVSKDVNKPINNDPSLIKSIT